MANVSLKQSVTFLLAEGDAWPEMRGEVIGLGGSKGNRSRGEQDRKQRFIACIVTTLIFWASLELNPTFRLLKIYYLPHIFVENRQKMCKKNGKRKKTQEREKHTQREKMGSLNSVSPPWSDQAKHLKSTSGIG